MAGARRSRPRGPARVVWAGGDQLVGGPLDRVGTGRQGRPHPSQDHRPRRLVLVGTPSPEQAGDGGGGDELAAAVEVGDLVAVEAGRDGRPRAGRPAPARLAETTTATVTENRAT